MPSRRTIVLVAIGLTGVVGLALDSNGAQRTHRLRSDLETLREKNTSLRAENDRLRRELQALADDPAELERAAREELGLVRPGEVVFRLEDGDEASAP